MAMILWDAASEGSLILKGFVDALITEWWTIQEGRKGLPGFKASRAHASMQVVIREGQRRHQVSARSLDGSNLARKGCRAARLDQVDNEVQVKGVRTVLAWRFKEIDMGLET